MQIRKSFEEEFLSYMMNYDHSREEDLLPAGAAPEEKAMVKLALLWFDYSSTIAVPESKALSELLCALNSILREAGYQMEDFMGQPLDDALRARVKVLGCRKRDCERDYILETVSPEISKNGRLIKTSVVIAASPNAV